MSLPVPDSTALPEPELAPELYEGVPLRRLLAFLADMVLIVVLSALVVPFTAFTGIFFFPALVAVVGFIYRVATITAGSATWGMRLAGLELRDGAGRRFDFGMAFLHTALFTVFISFMLPQIVSLVLHVSTPRRQGLHDLILGTAALRLPMA